MTPIFIYIAIGFVLATIEMMTYVRAHDAEWVARKVAMFRAVGNDERQVAEWLGHVAYVASHSWRFEIAWGLWFAMTWPARTWQSRNLWRLRFAAARSTIAWWAR